MAIFSSAGSTSITPFDFRYDKALEISRRMRVLSISDGMAPRSSRYSVRVWSPARDVGVNGVRMQWSERISYKGLIFDVTFLGIYSSPGGAMDTSVSEIKNVARWRWIISEQEQSKLSGSSSFAHLYTHAIIYIHTTKWFSSVYCSGSDAPWFFFIGKLPLTRKIAMKLTLNWTAHERFLKVGHCRYGHLDFLL